jgi:thymidylate synthase ThyX
MKPLTTSNLRVKFLGITPLLKDRSGVLNPQEIAAFSALLTFKGKSIKNLFRDTLKKGENLQDRISKILQRSSLIGHASVATTPSLSLNYEGSKFLDSALTGIYFSSSLVSSGRRTGTAEKDIVYPVKIFQNKKAKKIYQETSEKIIKFFNLLLSQGISKDEASKILQYGIYGTGIIQLPIESIVSLKRQYLAEKDWMPEEIGLLLGKIEKETKKLGIDLLYNTRLAAPRNVYPYPNIFKNPQKSNLVRELRRSEKLTDRSKIVSLDALITPELKNKLAKLGKKKKDTFPHPKKIKKEWLNFLSLLQEIVRDYNSALRIKVLSSIPWRIWGEKKRHRTCPQIIESIYYCVERTAKIFQRNKKLIRELDERPFISPLRFAREIEEVFSIPPSIKNNQKLLSEYLSTALKAFESYQALIKLKIKPRDAIFLIPRAVKIDILQEYDLYNLLAGYYPLRVCRTAEEEMRRNSLREVSQIKDILAKKGLGFLNKFIVPKCQIVGFCLEDKSCPMIFNSVKNYNEKFHQEMKAELKKQFEKNLKNLGK